MNVFLFSLFHSLFPSLCLHIYFRNIHIQYAQVRFITFYSFLFFHSISKYKIIQRWHRRWFTLKQGELPAQYFLEYYTDSTCRKRKGVIDLDVVEQVDAGLSLDRASIKFQWMFDMKTPFRTYYLAADTEQDMRNWVLVICQVCNLQETDEKVTTSPTPSPRSSTAQCK